MWQTDRWMDAQTKNNTPQIIRSGGIKISIELPKIWTGWLGSHYPWKALWETSWQKRRRITKILRPSWLKVQLPYVSLAHPVVKSDMMISYFQSLLLCLVYTGGADISMSLFIIIFRSLKRFQVWKRLP